MGGGEGIARSGWLGRLECRWDVDERKSEGDRCSVHLADTRGVGVRVGVECISVRRMIL